MPTQRELAILDSYLDPPEPDDFDYDAWFGEMSDLEYENMREDGVLCRDC